MKNTSINQNTIDMRKSDTEAYDTIPEDIVRGWVCPDDIDVDKDDDWGSECTIDKDEIITVRTRDNKEINMTISKFYRLIRSYRTYIAQVVPDIVYHACWYSAPHIWDQQRALPVFSSQLDK